jgi:hypothetical protein
MMPKNKNSKLAGLAGDSPRGGDRTTTDQPAAAQLFSYKAFADSRRRFEHSGEAIFTVGTHLLAISPGLNLLEGADVTAAKTLRSQGLAPVDPDELVPGELHDLASKTVQLAALEYMREHELTKPVTGPGVLRDRDLIELLDVRISAYGRRRPLNVSSISIAS